MLEHLIKLHVEQLANKNQFVIYYRDEENKKIVVFQSYKTLIAIYYPYENKLNVNYEYWDYSKTTLKHFKMFINEYTSYKYENHLQFLKEIENNTNIFWFNDSEVIYP